MLVQTWPASTFPYLIDHDLGVHLHVHSTSPSKFNFNLAHLQPPSSQQSQPPSASPISLDHGLQHYLKTRLPTLSKCISTLAWSLRASISLISFDHTHHGYIPIPSVIIYKCISTLALSQPRSVSRSSVNPYVDTPHRCLSRTASSQSRYIVC